jgi:hypothetical protein
MKGLHAELRTYREQLAASVELALASVHEAVARFAHQTGALLDRATQPNEYEEDRYEEDSSVSSAVLSSSSSSASSSSSSSDEDEDLVLYDEERPTKGKRPREPLEVEVVIPLSLPPAAAVKSKRKALPPKRRRKPVQRLDPSKRDDDDDGDYDDIDLEDDDDDDEDDGPPRDPQAEHRHQLAGFQAWRGSIARKRGFMRNWDDLSRTRGWFRDHYGEKLAMVRQNLGPECSNLKVIQARWDWVLAEIMAGHVAPQVTTRPGVSVEQCALCGGTKPCTHELDGWYMGWLCAALMDAWIGWCVVLVSILHAPADEDDDGSAEMRELDAAFATVMNAHADKMSGKHKRKK